MLCAYTSAVKAADAVCTLVLVFAVAAWEYLH